MSNTEQDCPQASLKVAFLGQSNSANHIPGSKHIDSNDIYMYDYKRQKCYKYKEPIAGASGSQGNVMSDLAVKLRNKLHKPIVIIALGESGSSILDWQYGKYSDKLDKILSTKAYLNSVDFFLWHQGESDAIQDMGQEAYFETLSKLITRTQEVFPKSKFGVSIATICGASSSKEIQKAQYRATTLRNTFNAADSDSILGELRYDGCHFNRKGANELANMYFKSIIGNINSQQTDGAIDISLRSK